jgi:hypothetical protein
MTEDFTNTMEIETVTGKAGFTRVSNGPPGSHALSGQWRMDAVGNDTRAGTLRIIKSTPGGMKLSDASESYEAPPDGKDHPRNGDSHSTVSLRTIDDYTLEETDKTDGKFTGVSRSTISQRAGEKGHGGNGRLKGAEGCPTKGLAWITAFATPPARTIYARAKQNSAPKPRPCNNPYFQGLYVWSSYRNRS